MLETSEHPSTSVSVRESCHREQEADHQAGGGELGEPDGADRDQGSAGQEGGRDADHQQEKSGSSCFRSILMRSKHFSFFKDLKTAWENFT